MDLRKNLFATLLFFQLAIDLTAQFTKYDVTNSGIQNNYVRSCCEDQKGKFMVWHNRWNINVQWDGLGSV